MLPKVVAWAEFRKLPLISVPSAINVAPFSANTPVDWMTLPGADVMLPPCRVIVLPATWAPAPFAPPGPRTIVRLVASIVPPPVATRRPSRTLKVESVMVIVPPFLTSAPCSVGASRVSPGGVVVMVPPLADKTPLKGVDVRENVPESTVLVWLVRASSGGGSA